MIRYPVNGGGGGGGGGGGPFIIAPAATGNAVTDTANLQAAVTSAAGKTLYILPGLYAMKVTNQNAVLISANNTTVIAADNAVFQLQTTATFTAPWGTDIDHVVGMFTITGNGCTLKGGIFDWNTTNAALNQYAAQIATLGTASNTVIDGPQFRHSASQGVWNVNCSFWWCQNTRHTGGTAQDILVTRNVNMLHVYINKNYIDSSTPGPGFQASINVSGGDGVTLQHWSINDNIVDAGEIGSENPHNNYTAIQVFATNNADGVSNTWRNGSCCRNIVNGCITPGGGGVAECISLIQCSQTVVNDNSCYDCYIGIEFAGFNSTIAGNTIDGIGRLFAGILMDGAGRAVTVSGNTILGMGVWNPSFGIQQYGSQSTFTGNTCINELGGAQSCFLINMQQNPAGGSGPDGNTIVGNRAICGGPGSLAISVNNCSNTLVEGNSTAVDAGARGALGYTADGTFGHASRSNVVFKNNTAVGGPILFFIGDATDIGDNFYLQANAQNANAPIFVNAQSGTSYTLLLQDAGGVRLKFTNAGAVTLTIPTNASVRGIPIGTEIEIEQFGTGVVTPTAAGGVTLHGTGTHTSAQYAVALLTKTDTNTWSLSGQIA